MSVRFSESELINIAIGIERRGIAFYEVMAITTEPEEVSHTFQHLAAMEREHLQLFQGMLEESTESPPQGSPPPEYLQALVDSTVFTDDLIDSEMAAQANSVSSALELAIVAEKDSILFYYEMREIMPARIRAAVNQIMDEEKSHLRQLTELRKQLGRS